MCTCRVLCCCTRKGVRVCWGWVSIPASVRLARTPFEKVTLDWIATESEEEKRNRGFCNRHGLDPYMVPVSSFLKAVSVPTQKRPHHHKLTHLQDGAIVFLSAVWFAMCSSSRNSVTPFSNNVNIIQLLFFSSLPRGDSLFLLKGAGTSPPPKKKTHQDRCEDLGAGFTFPVEVVCYLF